MTTALKFRNIDASPDDPVETWPFEGILAAVERGTLPDWRRLATAIQADPWGPVAHQVLEAVRLSHPYGTTELLEGVVARARELAVGVGAGGGGIRGARPSSPDPGCQGRISRSELEPLGPACRPTCPGRSCPRQP